MLDSTPSTVPSLESPSQGAPRLRVGERFHGLLVHSILGEGAMGSAYLASHPVLQMPLVIKTFKASVDANIFREAHLAARVTSPNVVSVLDAGYESGTPFVIQSYIDGIDLSELIQHLKLSDWRLPVNVVCRIVIDVAKGLHSIHQAGVIHRDVKPANLFLHGSSISTVGDFGIAFDPVKEEGEQYGAGTPMFMAPEQWELGGRLGPYTDIYALGATAHLLATERYPFEAQSLSELREAHLYKPYRAPEAKEPGEAYLFSVIERAMRKRPEERFTNAGEMARVLKVVAQPAPEVVCTGQDKARIGHLSLELIQGDLSAQEGDVIVNAANKRLTMREGVANALRLAGGQSLEVEAMSYKPSPPVPMGTVVWTSAGALRARWVAHAVAAIGGAICLQRATLRVLLGAEVRHAAFVLFPALGTGVGDVPMDLAAKLILEAIRTFAALEPAHVRAIRIVLYDERGLSRWRSVLRSM